MMQIVSRLDDHHGFKLVKHIKKNNINMYMHKESGHKNVTIKFTVDKIKIPIFNLLALVYETELYDKWFPFCKKSFDVSL